MHELDHINHADEECLMVQNEECLMVQNEVVEIKYRNVLLAATRWAKAI